MNFADYYNLNKKKYEFRIKIAGWDLSEDVKQGISNHLKKYELEGNVEFKKTPLQENPMDFPNIKNVEVYITDIVTNYPITPDILKTDIANTTGICAANIAVYTKKDPRLADQDLYVQRTSPEFKDNYVAKLGSEYEAPEKVKYGQEQIDDLMAVVKKDISDRKDNTVTNKLIPKQVTDGATVSGPEQGQPGKDGVLTKVQVSKHSPVKKVTMFSKESKDV